MHSYFHVAPYEIVGHQGKYGDRVETVPYHATSLIDAALPGILLLSNH